MQRIRGFENRQGGRILLEVRASLQLERFGILHLFRMRVDTGSTATLIMPQDWGNGLIPSAEWATLIPEDILTGVGGVREYAVVRGVLRLIDEDGGLWAWPETDIRLVLPGENDLGDAQRTFRRMDIIGLGSFIYRSNPSEVLLELP